MKINDNPLSKEKKISEKISRVTPPTQTPIPLSPNKEPSD
jgi:hypothetical protein|tara:strand:+ start:1253 stop:1372 length:120 start_codon:yes stop_codon:yes gene_type:complete